jgi:glycosyltransferase involved in cell wall biosynthesis
MKGRNTTRPTILFLHPSSELFGADRTLLDLVVRLDPDRFRAVVRLPGTGPLVEKLEAAGAVVEFGPLGIGAQASLGPRGLLRLAWELPRSILSVLRTIRRHRPALIHTNTMIVLGGAIAAWLSRRPHLWHIHEIPTRPVWLARVFAPLFALLAQRVVCNSHATADCFRSHCRRLAGKTRVIWNGTALGGDGRSPSEIETDIERVRRDLGLTPSQPLVLLPGRINRWKGQRRLVEAARALRDRYPDARYLIVGAPPPGQGHFGEELDRAIEEAELEGIVLRRDFVPDLTALLRTAQLVVVPSTRPEPFGLVAIEAMACARPVIAADHGGLAEIVRHGCTGLLVQPDSAPALTNAISDLLRSPLLAARLGRAGQQRQRSHFSLESYGTAFAEEYEELTAPAGPEETVRLDSETRIRHLVLGKANPERMNGVNVVVHELARAQIEAGLDAEVWGITADPTASTPSRPYELRLFEKRRNPFLLPRTLIGALREVEGPTLFHLHGGFIPLFPALARQLDRLGLPFVLTPHGAFREVALRRSALVKWFYLRLLERPLLRRARALQTFTESEARDTEKQIATTPVVVLPNGLAVPEGGTRVPDEVEGDRAETGPIFAFCGRLDTHTKGLDLLFEGMARYHHEGGRGALHLIGAGEDQQALVEHTRRLGIADRVRFLGARFGSDKRRALREADVFVLTSRNEGMPVSALEGASLELPLLISRETNLGAEVLEYDAGYVLSSNRPEEIANAMHHAESDLAEGELRPRGGRAARMQREHFSWPPIVAEMNRNLYGIAAPTPHVLPPRPTPSIARSLEVREPQEKLAGRAS